MNIRTSIQSFFKKWIRRSKCKKYGLEFPVCCKAHGVGKRERQGALAQSRSGDELQLVHIALDEFPFNVYVYSIELNRILGYLEETLAKNWCSFSGRAFAWTEESRKLREDRPSTSISGAISASLTR